MATFYLPKYSPFKVGRNIYLFEWDLLANCPGLTAGDIVYTPPIPLERFILADGNAIDLSGSIIGAKKHISPGAADIVQIFGCDYFGYAYPSGSILPIPENTQTQNSSNIAYNGPNNVNAYQLGRAISQTVFARIDVVSASITIGKFGIFIIDDIGK